MSSVTKETQQCLLFSIVVDVKNRVVHTPWTVLEGLYYFAGRECFYFDLISQTIISPIYSCKAPNIFLRFSPKFGCSRQIFIES